MPASSSSVPSWRSTRVSRLLQVELPIIQGPFGGFPSQHLTAEVSNLGGLGSFGAVTLSGSAIQEAIGELRSLTSKPFAINLWVSASDQKAAQVDQATISKRLSDFARYYTELHIEPPQTVAFAAQDFAKQVRAAVDADVPVLSFIYGVPPAEIIAECKRRGIVTVGTATTVEEALALEEAGLQLVIASGFEGAGHRGSFLRPAAESLMGAMSLIPQVVDAIEVPIIASGGIADCRGVAAAFALGAEAVQIGTAFLACTGSGASAEYRAMLVAPTAKQTALTDRFTGRLARGISNRWMIDLENDPEPPLPFPIQNALTQSVSGPAARQGKTDLMSMWAGQSAGLCQEQTAAGLMAKLVSSLDSSMSKRA